MEKNWFYSVDGQEKKGPVAEHELKRLLAGSQIPVSTLVWSEGMANWASAGSVAALQTSAGPAGGTPMLGVASASTPPSAASELPAGLSGWMTFVAVMHIIGGAFACLSCFGLIYGVPMIMGGAALLGAKNLLVTMPSVDANALPFLEKLRSAFKLTGWSYILMMIATIIIMVVYIGVIAAVVAGALPKAMPH